MLVSCHLLKPLLLVYGCSPRAIYGIVIISTLTITDIVEDVSEFVVLLLLKLLNVILLRMRSGPPDYPASITEVGLLALLAHLVPSETIILLRHKYSFIRQYLNN